jgi:penicillin G amidase
MATIARRFLFVVLGLLLVLAILILSTFYILPRRSFPKTSGEVQLEGLSGPVEIFRDQYGIPHIYASSSQDLFFAQGYVHAQDRFWQMDFWRHIGSGRLSEMFGEATVETDMFLRTLGFEQLVKEEIEQLGSSETLAVLQSYSDGINAYLAERQGLSLSLEYGILGLINADYTPEPWSVEHTLTWAKMMAWDLGGNMDIEIRQGILMQSLSPQELADITPPYPEDHPVIVPGYQAAGNPGQAAADYQQLSGLDDLLAVVRHRTSLASGFLGPRQEGLGSNNWVISGERTSTGMPLLANDPHLGVQLPSIWYENGLHCTPKGAECPYEVTGYSFASAPGVVLGFNNHIAWGVTNVNPDVQDLFIEKINPANPNQYEFQGQWLDMDVKTELIQVAGGEPVELTIRSTHHGPIISDTYGSLEDLDAGVVLESSGSDSTGIYAISLRWTALEPTSTFVSVLQLNQAENFEQFREALWLWDVPSQNFVYADVEGNIGYQMPGIVPMRANGDGMLPVPGWTGDYEWVDRIPFEDLPFAYNPPEGYIVSANNAVVGAEYPYLLTTGWDFGYRARRVVEMIEYAPGPVDAAYIATMHGDNKNLNAGILIPVLVGIPLEETRLERARALLMDWDHQQHMDSPAATLFEVFWRNLLVKTFNDDLPEDFQPGGNSLWFEIVRRLVQQPESSWWDDKETPEVEGRDDIFLASFAEAVDELEQLQGKDPERWNWGDLHTVTFKVGGLGESGNPLVDILFNRGPFRTSGGASIVNATGWDARSGHYGVRSLPSMRMIVDLGDLSRSLGMHTTGQSGHAYHPNYIDMTGRWAAIEYHPMLWERSQVEESAGKVLRLVPGASAP